MSVPRQPPVIAPLQRLTQSLEAARRIAFDLDGTLYDTRDFERPALAAVAGWLREKAGHPLEGLAQELWERREMERHRPGLFDDLLVKHDLPVAWGAECLRRFHAHPADELQDADSLKDFLLELRAAGRRLALVSNGPGELQKRKCASLGFDGIFDECIYCDPSRPERQKPSPWAWSRLEAWRGALRTIYVGDDSIDAEFAKSGGAGFVPFLFRSPKYED
jgi:FMN phosphatase YigB (HAD superfamily)